MVHHLFIVLLFVIFALVKPTHRGNYLLGTILALGENFLGCLRDILVSCCRFFADLSAI